MSAKRSIIVQSIVAIFVIGIAGCTEPPIEPVPVSGKVLIDGQPLESGTIRFVPKTGRPASSTILADGSFDLAVESIDQTNVMGIPPGDYRVQVSASKIVDDETINWIAPQRYADFRTSALQVVVEKPLRGLVIELKSDQENEPAEELEEDPGAAEDASVDAPAAAVSQEAGDS